MVPTDRKLLETILGLILCGKEIVKIKTAYIKQQSTKKVFLTYLLKYPKISIISRDLYSFW